MAITARQIEALRAEAAEHGDSAQVAICEIALTGDLSEALFAAVPDGDCERISAMDQATARNECARVIAAATQ